MTRTPVRRRALGLTVSALILSMGSLANGATAQAGPDPTANDPSPSTTSPSTSSPSTTSPAAAPKSVEPPLVGKVTTPSGVPLEGVTATGPTGSTSTDRDGRFSLPGDHGAVTVSAAGYRPVSFDWAGGADRVDITLVPTRARGIHISGGAAGSQARWEELIALAGRTALNALVIDVKAEAGRVLHHTGVAAAHEMGAVAATHDLAARTEDAHNRGLYVIVRIVAFQDPIAAPARPEWAAWDTTTNAPYDQNGQKFLDPTDPAPRAYILDLAEEACRMGVDEVQFDYIRFPAGFHPGVRFDGGSSAPVRQETITSFLAEATQRLRPLGCRSAAAIFGFITNIPGEGGIGQQLESLAAAGDVLSPMVYPALYSTGWYGYQRPVDHPYEIVFNGTSDAVRRLDGWATQVRPWIQDYRYTAEQVRAEIDAAEHAGTGWMLWNINSEFTEPALPGPHELYEPPAVAPWFRIRPHSGFFDVENDSLFAPAVTWLDSTGITTGCNPPWADEFCPDQPVTRGQMAAFLARALDLTERSPDPFTDDDDTVFAPDIERLHAAGLTTGCKPPGATEPDPTRYCPDQPVTRAHMAAFLYRALA